MSVTVRLSSKGQLTLPVSVREALDLEQGDSLELEIVDGNLVLSPLGSLASLTDEVMSWIAPGTTPVIDVSAYYSEHRND